MILLASTLQTGYGSWNALVWFFVFILVVMLTMLLRAAGRRDYKAGTNQTKPFVSGNELPDGHHIRAGNLYWGYLEALKGYYQKLAPLHTGVATDYVLWFFGVLVLLALMGMMP